MKLSAGGVFAAVAAVIFLSWGAGRMLGNHSQSPPATPTTASSATSRSPSPASKSNPSTQARRKARQQNAKQVVGSPDQAVAQADVFIQAYYLLLPSDTAATRKARVAPYVTRFLLARLPLGLPAGTTADKTRVDNLLVQKGVPLMNRKVVAASGETVVLSLPVAVSLRRPNGMIVHRFQIVTNSKWSYAHGRWLLTSFQEGSDSG